MTIVSQRLFKHPRAQVYAAFSDPAQLTRWWGPNGFTNDFRTFDLRPGGDWLFVMTGPEGQTFDMKKRFIEVVPGERVVVEHLQPMHHFTMTQTFEDQDGGTLLTWTMVFHSQDETVPNLDRFIAQANEQNFDRLEALLGAHD